MGWKAPPKPARETVVKQPTQGQADAAKRLSQGLSVAANHQTARYRYVGQNHLNVPNALANTGYSVVLDPHEYQQLSYGAGAGAVGTAGAGMQQQAPNGTGLVQAGGAPYVPVYGGVYPTFNKDAKYEVIGPSTKASRYVRQYCCVLRL